MVSASHTVHMLLMLMVKVQLGVTVYSKITLNSVMVKFVPSTKEESKLRICVLLLLNMNNAQLN
jgi:hypothetical protein